MGETLDALRRLQEIEQQLAELRAQEEKRQKQVRIQKRQIEKCRQRIESRKVDLRSCQMEVDRLDLDVKSREEHMATRRETLKRARTDKEYSTILTMINTEKVDSAKIESHVLELMSQMDVVRASSKRDGEEQALCTQRLEAAEARLRDYIDSTAEQRAALEAQRDEAATGVPHHALVMFSRTAERHDGEALAPITRLHPKRDEYACGGCNMKVTLETVNLLRSRDELRMCSSCGRILFIES